MTFDPCSRASSALHRGARCWILALSLALLVTACGKKGMPLPPQSFAPVAARDLTLHQQGSVLIVEVSYPQSTSAGTVLPGLEAVEVWDLDVPTGLTAEAVDPGLFARSAELLTRVQGVELASAIAGDRLRLAIALDEGGASQGQDQHLFAVRTVSTTRDVSDFSNLVALRLGPAPPAPTGLQLRSESDGVVVSWDYPDAVTSAATDDAGADVDDDVDEQLGAGPANDLVVGFHVYRKSAQQRTYADPLPLVARDERSLLDRSARFGERYFYTVRAVASETPLVESDASVEGEVDHQDVFAPPPPAAITALAEVQRVRLLITPSPADDVAGYVVFRQDPRADDFRRLNQTPIGTLEYIDTGLQSGLTYRYRVSAVDRAGNQGEAGEQVEVTVR